MKRKSNFLGMIIMLLSAIVLLTSCGNEIRDIPSGYVAKKLTPTGWDKDILEAGQVDIGQVSNGSSTSLVLLEVTTQTVKEKFVKVSGDDKEDHRMRTKDGTPLDVDIYTQISIPTDPKVRNMIFSMITPSDTKVDRVSVITVEDVYVRFAQMTIRGNARAIFAKYQDADDVMRNYQKINAEISQMIITVAKDSKAPFEIVSAQLSNVKEDSTILESKNKLVAAKNEVQAIEMVGDAIRKNPYYLDARRLDVLEKIGTKASSSLVVMDSKSATTLSLPTK